MFVSRRRQIYSGAERRRRMEQAVTSLVAEGFMLGYGPADIVELVEARTREAAASASSKPSNKGGAR